MDIWWIYCSGSVSDEMGKIFQDSKAFSFSSFLVLQLHIQHFDTMHQIRIILSLSRSAIIPLLFSCWSDSLTL